MTNAASEFSKPRIFISYSRSDGREAAELLGKWLEREKLTVWRDLRQMGSGDILPQVLDAIEQAEHLLLVLTRGALESEWVRREIDHARKHGVMISPVLADPSLRPASLPPWLREKEIFDLRESERRDRLVAQLRGPGTVTRVSYNLPPLPASLVKRPVQFDRLKKLVLAEKGGGTVGVTTALAGAGGYGKTTLANMLCHDEDVQRHFTGGILRVEIGKERPSVLGLIADLVEQLDPKGHRPGFQDEGSAAGHLAETIGEARLLLVLDDVWREAQLRPFLRGGPNCVRLVTTRQARLLPGVNDQVKVDELTADEALALLSWNLPEPGPTERQALQVLTGRLGKWAQMLEIANGWLRSRIGKGAKLGPLLMEFGQRLDAKGLLGFDPRDADARNHAIRLCVEASLADLSVDEMARFMELAILPEDTDVPITTVTAFWGYSGGMDRFDAEDLLNRLGDLSLLQRLELGEGVVRLHDNMKWLLRDRLGQEGVRAAHGRMADAIRVAGGGSFWWILPYEDAYGWAHGLDHLRGAGREWDVARCLTCYEWIKGRLNTTGAQGLLEAYLEEGEGSRAYPIRRALALSMHVLSRWPDQLGIQLSQRVPIADYSNSKGMIFVEDETFEAATTSPEPEILAPEEILEPEIDFSKPSPLSLELALDAASANFELEALWDRKFRPRWQILTPADTEIARMECCDTAVACISFSADGNRLFSGCYSYNPIDIWNVDKATYKEKLVGHESTVFSIAVSPDGRYLLSGSFDCTVRLWDADTGEQLACFKGHRGLVNGVAFLPDGSTALSGSEDGTVRLWDMETHEQIGCLVAGDYSAVSCIAVSPDGSRLLTGSYGVVHVWDMTSYTEIGYLAVHENVPQNWVWSIAVSPDGQHFASSSRDGAICIGTLETEKQRPRLKIDGSWARAILFSSDGSCLILGCADGNIRLWSVDTGEELGRLRGHENAISCLALSPDGRRLLSGSSDCFIRLWDMTVDPDTKLLERHNAAVNSVKFSQDGRYLASGSSDRTVRIWSAETGSETACLREHEETVRVVAFSKNNKSLFSGSDDGAVRVWDLETFEEIVCLFEENRRIIGFAFLEAQHFLAWSGENSHHGLPPKILNITECEEIVLNDSLASDFGISSFDASPDGKIMIASSYSKIIIIDAMTGAAISTLEGHAEVINCLIFSPDGQRLLSGSTDQTARLWDVAEKKEIACLEHDGSVLCIRFSPGGQFILSGSTDRTLRIWDAHSYDLLAVLSLDAAVNSIDCHGSSIAVGDALGRVGVLDVTWNDTPPSQDLS